MPLPFEKRAVEMALKDSKGRNIAKKIDEVTANVDSITGFDGEISVSYIPSASRYVISKANLPKKTGLYKLVYNIDGVGKETYGWCRYVSTSGGYQGRLDTYLFNGKIYVETATFSTSYDKTIGDSNYELVSGTPLFRHYITAYETGTSGYSYNIVVISNQGSQYKNGSAAFLDYFLMHNGFIIYSSNYYKIISAKANSDGYYNLTAVGSEGNITPKYYPNQSYTSETVTAL